MTDRILAGDGDRGVDARAESTIAETEGWFVRQGLPHFIAGYTATGSVLPRAVPVLLLAFLFSDGVDVVGFAHRPTVRTART